MPGGLGVRGLVRLLSSEVNLGILAVLSLGEAYPREIARIVGRDESDVSRRLRRLEEAGLVRGEWVRVGGRNVRVYRLEARVLRVEVDGGVLRVAVPAGGGVEAVVPVAAPPAGVEPVGRGGVLEGLAGASEPVVHVWGPPGVGKTSLVAWHLSRARSGGPVYWHYSDESDTPRFMALRLGVFLAGLGYPGLLAGVGGLDAAGVADSVLEGASAAGAILVFDDYHRLRGEAAGVVRRIAERAGQAGVRVYVLSRRREQRLPWWRGEVYGVELGPLDARGVEEVLERGLGRRPSEAEVGEALRWSGGVPGVLAAAIAAASRGTPLGEALRSAARAYYGGEVLYGLTSDEAGLLDVLVVAGGWVGLEEACRAAGLAGDRCERALRGLASAALAEEAGGRVRAVEALEPRRGLMGEARRRRIAASLAGSLYASPSHRCKARAFSLLAGECMAREAAGLVLDRLATGSSFMLCCLGDYTGALERLLRECGPGPWERAVLGVEWGIMAKWNVEGDLAGALRLVEAGLPALRRRPAAHARVLALKVVLHLHLSQVGEAEEAFREALAAYERLPRREKAPVAETLYSAAAYLHFARGELEDALEATAREEALALEIGDPANYAIARIHRAEIYRYMGRHGEALAILEELEDDPALSRYLKGQVKAKAAVPRAFALIALSRHKEALAAAREALEAGAGLYTPILHVAAAVASCLQGDPDAAKESLRKAMPEGGECPEEDPDCALVQALKAALEGAPPPRATGIPYIDEVAKLIVSQGCSGAEGRGAAS